jgi:homoserine O-succinyltransferase
MPDAALCTTERQFRELLAAASADVPVSLRLFSLPELRRSDAARSHVHLHYEDIGELWSSDIDGLIVTGTEPRASDLTEEPYWHSLTKLIDWAQDHTASAVWSCLAAHAAVLYLDGITRRPLSEKLVGVFECLKAMNDGIVRGAPARWRVPHSRYNELPEEGLVERGYRILSRSADAGADMFVAERNSLFLYMQGHPEYDPGAMFREYRRDVGRFLSEERASYPEIPRDYFDDETTAAFAAFRHKALRNRKIDFLANFPSLARGEPLNAWREPAVRIYANWLSYLAERRFAAAHRCSREPLTMA